MPYYSKHDLISKLQELGIYLDKTRGQCYLIDNNIIERIISFANLNPESDIALEIGPGMGILSEKLIKSTKLVYLVDNDKKIAEFLSNYYGQNHEVELISETEVTEKLIRKNYDDLKPKKIYIVHADILKIPFPPLTKIVANIPYQISAPILFKIMKEWNFESVILMVQKEFAQRLGALPNTKNYSRLAAATQLFLNVEILHTVSPKCFFPEPKVTSQIIKLTAKVNLQPNSETRANLENYLAFLRGIFPYKNKTLQNALKFYFKNDKNAQAKLLPLYQLITRESDEEKNIMKNYDKNYLQNLLSSKLRAISSENLFEIMMYGLLNEKIESFSD